MTVNSPPLYMYGKLGKTECHFRGDLSSPSIEMRHAGSGDAKKKELLNFTWGAH